MRLWPQSSQRSTWPPSAAVRQLLDRRHDLELAQAHMAGIGSAPSRPHGDERCPRPPASGGAPPPGYASGRGLPSIKGASRSSGLVTARIVRTGNAGVKRRGVELGMAEQRLDHADIDALLEQVRGEAVPQRVRRHALGDPRGLGGGADNAAELAGRQRLDRVAAWKQPASRQQQAAPPPLAPPGAQQFEQLRRQHRVAVLASLAALDAQQHALGIDIADLERDNFRDAQPGAVGGGERRLVLRRRCRAAAAASPPRR